MAFPSHDRLYHSPSTRRHGSARAECWMKTLITWMRRMIGAERYQMRSLKALITIINYNTCFSHQYPCTDSFLVYLWLLSQECKRGSRGLRRTPNSEFSTSLRNQCTSLWT